MHKFWIILPKKLFITLISILILTWIFNFVLKKYDARVKESIEKIRMEQVSLINNIKREVQKRDVYVNFAHFMAVKTIFNKKKSILEGIEKISTILPKAFHVNYFYFDNENNSFAIEGYVKDFPTFLKVVKYFDNAKEIQNLKRTHSFEEGGIIKIKIEGTITK